MSTSPSPDFRATLNAITTIQLGEFAEFTDRAITEVAAGARPTFEPRKLADAGRAVHALLTEVFHGDEKALAADLTERGVDSTFAAAAASFAAEIDAALALAPPDLRRYEVVSPEHRDRVERAANFLGRIKKSASDEAWRTGRLDDMKALGRGLDIDRSDPISVRNGLQQFAHGAKTRMPLLKAAGFVPRDFAAVDAAIAEMNEIEADQTSRRAIKNTVIDRIFTLALAAEGYFRVYRARARLAAGPDDQLMTRLTAPLLRSEERRRAVVVKAQLPNGDPTK